MLGKSSACLKERVYHLFSFAFLLFVTFLFCYSPSQLKTQGFGRIQGHQWKECSSFCSQLTLAWMGKDTGICHLTLPATMFSSPWSTINFISEPFAEESRGRKMSPQHAAVWEEMVGVRALHGQCTVKNIHAAALVLQWSI